MSDWIATVLLAMGLGFFAAGSVGLLRLPELHSRLHALTKADNLGLGLLAAGLAVFDGGLLTAVKLFLIWVLVLAASAASAHLIAQQALRRVRALASGADASVAASRPHLHARPTHRTGPSQGGQGDDASGLEQA
jgi:multicomponent Na+:H+ antiporter subunit G